jgi:serine protease 16
VVHKFTSTTFYTVEDRKLQITLLDGHVVYHLLPQEEEARSFLFKMNLVKVRVILKGIFIFYGPWAVTSLPQLRYRDIWVSSLGVDSKDPVGNHEIANSDVKELYMTQRLDHFDATNEATYQQRYFVSYRYHTMVTGPILNLLCVGGEGPGFDASVLIDSVHCTGDMLELAKRIASHQQYNVHLYALEHRYYGKSYPTFDDGESPLTIRNLRYLSSQQALEDLAHFVHEINKEASTTSSMWVAFGGSYPGMMALYARYKYPHLIYAAVSSSAPINTQVEFPGYKARQGWDLTYDKVGGSLECHRIVKVGHDQAVSLLETNVHNTNGQVTLATMFNLCNPATALEEKRNQEMLLGDGLIDIPAQGNDPSCSESDLCNIDGLCKFMTRQFTDTTKYNKNDPPKYPELEVLAKVSQKQQQGKRLDNDCLPVDFEAMLNEVMKTEVDVFGWRSWLYQTCSEFGFYQICGDDCPFASHFHQIDLDLEICEKVFNVSNVYENVQDTRDRYGALDIINADASRILSVNGNVDPWSVLGLGENDQKKYSMPIKEVDGASHHFWTHAVKDTDSREIMQAREYIYSVVLDWIGVDSGYDLTT